MYHGIGLGLIIMALCQVTKNAFKLNTNYIPLLSTLLGVLAGIFLLNDWFMGLAIGLSACGLFDFVKKPVVAMGQSVLEAFKK